MSKPMQDMTDDEIELEIQRLDTAVMATRAEMRALNAVLTTRRHASIARDKVAMLVVFGDDPCPRSSDDEIIVCSRYPESERYRIPEKLRKPPKKAADRGWSDRVRTLETVSAMGRPNSCSPVGSNGQTGCIDKFLSEWRDQRRAEESDGPQ